MIFVLHSTRGWFGIPPAHEAQTSRSGGTVFGRLGRLQVLRVRDEELVANGLAHHLQHFLEVIVERAGADGPGELRLVGDAEPGQALPMGTLLVQAEDELPLHDREGVRRYPRVETEPPLRLRDDVALEELPDGDHQ